MVLSPIHSFLEQFNDLKKNHQHPFSEEDAYLLLSSLQTIRQHAPLSKQSLGEAQSLQMIQSMGIESQPNLQPSPFYSAAEQLNKGLLTFSYQCIVETQNLSLWAQLAKACEKHENLASEADLLFSTLLPFLAKKQQAEILIPFLKHSPPKSAHYLEALCQHHGSTLLKHPTISDAFFKGVSVAIKKRQAPEAPAHCFARSLDVSTFLELPLEHTSSLAACFKESPFLIEELWSVHRVISACSFEINQIKAKPETLPLFFAFRKENSHLTLDERVSLYQTKINDHLLSWQNHFSSRLVELFETSRELSGKHREDFINFLSDISNRSPSFFIETVKTLKTSYPSLDLSFQLSDLSLMATSSALKNSNFTHRFALPLQLPVEFVDLPQQSFNLFDLAFLTGMPASHLKELAPIVQPQTGLLTLWSQCRNYPLEEHKQLWLQTLESAPTLKNTKSALRI